MAKFDRPRRRHGALTLWTDWSASSAVTKEQNPLRGPFGNPQDRLGRWSSDVFGYSLVVCRHSTTTDDLSVNNVAWYAQAIWRVANWRKLYLSSIWMSKQSPEDEKGVLRSLSESIVYSTKSDETGRPSRHNCDVIQLGSMICDESAELLLAIPW